MLHILDQQVAAQALDALDHTGQRVAGQQQLGGHIQAGIGQLLGFIGQPLAVVAEQPFTFPAVAHQTERVDIVDEYVDIE
ncbi:hypothetical protein D3C80_2022360 [compost metagenome]